MATESFFSNASLAYLASAGAGKDGKTYSIKPSDGTGDFTFSRGTDLAATRVGPTGLIEKGRENLFTYSNDFSNASWNKSETSVASGQSGYDGSSDAWNLIPSATDTNSHRMYKDYSSGGGVFTTSIYAKANGYDFLKMFNSSGGVIFDVSTGNPTSGTIISESGTPIDANIISVGNGWYRIDIVKDSASGSLRTQLFVQIDAANTSFAGDGVKGILIQDAQLEIGLAATDYIESGASPGKAGLLEDEPRFDYSGGATCPSLLLEPSRTQLIKQSEYFGGWDISSTYTNTTTQNKEGREINSLYGLSAIAVTLPSAGTYSYSVYAKKDTWDFLVLRETNFATSSRTWFDLANGVVTNAGSSHGTPTITPEGNGWYRCTIYLTESTDLIGNITFTQAQTSGSLTSGANDQEAIFVDMAQLEAGSYPTSYIPNHSGGSATRTQDNPAQLDITGLTSTYNTLYAEFEVSSITYQGKIALSDNSQTNRMTIFQNTGDLLLLLNVGGSSQTPITASSVLSVGTNFKVIAKHQNGSHALFINGTKIGEETSTTPTGLNRLRYGNELETNDTQKFLGNIKQTLIFPEALSDADCISLTTL